MIQREPKFDVWDDDPNDAAPSAELLPATPELPLWSDGVTDARVRNDLLRQAPDLDRLLSEIALARNTRLLTGELAQGLAALAELPGVVSELRAEVAQLRERIAILEHGDPEQLLTAEDAAPLLGMTPGALRKAASRGKFPYVRKGRRIRFQRAALLGKPST